MEEYIIEINRSLTFQRVNSELRYKPDDPFIRTIVIGIRPKGSETEDDWLAYVECMIWNTSSMKETIFSHYACTYEKDQPDKPFSAICNYLKKNYSPKSFFENKLDGRDARPQSRGTREPTVRRKMLPGFMSRWMMPRE